MKRRHNRLADMRVAIEAVLLVARKVMVDGVYKSHTDNNGLPFKPLAASTVERKQRQGLSLNPLVATGAMLDIKTFKIRASKRKGRLTHTAPKGSHSKYGTGRRGRAKTVGQKLGQSTGETLGKYDYGLAHQYSKRFSLPRRQWGLEPGTKKWKAIQNMIPRIVKEHATGTFSSPYLIVARVFQSTGLS